MKKLKYIMICVFFAFCIALLYLAGTVFFVEKDQKTEEVQKNIKETNNQDNKEQEMLYSEEFGVEYPATPTEPGMQLAVSEQLQLPEDSYLEKLSIYDFHERFQPDSAKEQKLWAKSLSEMLLETFFLEEQWKMVVVSDAYQDNYVYRLKGKKQNAFQYTANKNGGDNTQLLCEEGMIKVPEPEDGDWDQAFREYSLSMLERFEAGLWDGETCHMAVSKTENIAGSNGSYQYMMEFDNIMGTKYIFSELRNSYSWANFEYKNGSLISMHQISEIIIDKKRPLEATYKNMEEAFQALKQSLEIYFTNYAQNTNQYNCIYIDEIKLEYLNYYSKATKKLPTIVPILTAKLKVNSYDIEKSIWEQNDNMGYMIQLETGESCIGKLGEDFFTWRSPMTDELKRENS